MSIDKSQIETCCIWKKDINPKYLGVGNDGKPHYWYEGNNALPVADGRCCDACNQIVLVDRITNLTMSRMQNNHLSFNDAVKKAKDLGGNIWKDYT